MEDLFELEDIVNYNNPMICFCRDMVNIVDTAFPVESWVIRSSDYYGNVELFIRFTTREQCMRIVYLDRINEPDYMGRMANQIISDVNKFKSLHQLFP